MSKQLTLSSLIRFGVSIEKSLIEQFDHFIGEKGYHNRSEAIRDLIREKLIGERMTTTEEIVGTLTIIYDHHKPHLVEKLIALQHQAEAKIIASQHVHLDHEHCLESIIVRGPDINIEALAGQIGALKGVGQCILTRTSCQVMHDEHVDQRDEHSHGPHKHL